LTPNATFASNAVKNSSATKLDGKRQTQNPITMAAKDINQYNNPVNNKAMSTQSVVFDVASRGGSPVKPQIPYSRSWCSASEVFSLIHSLMLDNKSSLDISGDISKSRNSSDGMSRRVTTQPYAEL
jgi:hypothetical protein